MALNSLCPGFSEWHFSVVIVTSLFFKIIASAAVNSKITDQDESAWFAPDCDRNITLVTGSTSSNVVGLISSPGYPDNYPMPGTVCKYTFSAIGPQAAKMRVQVTFVDFDLKTMELKQEAVLLICDQTDHVRIGFPAAPSNPLKFCGKTRPYAVMSPTSSLELFFITEPATSPSVSMDAQSETARGFQFQYRFVHAEREDGRVDISEPQQQQPLENSGCEFKFRSWQATNGSFSSANHPGFYPRNHNCAYHFIGRPNERVMLIFGFFDVRSSSPDCIEGDYIQIEYPQLAAANSDGSSSSNRQGQQNAMLLTGPDGTEVRDDYNGNSNSNQRYTRYCSTRRPHGSIFSNWPHLLLTFRSDNRDDGRGFDAYYQFVAADEAAVHQQQAGAQRLQSNGVTRTTSHHKNYCIATILSFLLRLIFNNINYYSF